MRYAKSIYRGGEIIDASLCDYHSSQKLGLICPFCSQAVFLRVGSCYERQGKKIVSPESFCHYHNDDPSALECELRAKRKDGEEYIEKLRIESRNQRLKLFSARMTDILKQSWPANYPHIKQLNKIYGQRWLEHKMIECRKEISDNISFYRTEIEQLHNKIKSIDFNNLDILTIWTSEEIKQQNEAMNFIDHQIHLTICTEVLEFLATKTGGYAFLKFLSLGIITLSLTGGSLLFKRQVGLEFVQLMAQTVKQYDTQKFLRAICLIIVATNWLNIYQDLANSQEIN